MRLSSIMCALCVMALVGGFGLGCPAQTPQENPSSEQTTDGPGAETQGDAGVEPAAPDSPEPTTEPPSPDEPVAEASQESPSNEPGIPDARESAPEPTVEPGPEPTPEPDAAGGDGTTPEGSNKSCSFNKDCPTEERCECDENTGCFCKVGVRGTGQNGVDTCTTGNDCASALCVEGNGGVYYCSGECSSANDCKEKLPVCAKISFVGQVCIRQRD